MKRTLLKQLEYRKNHFSAEDTDSYRAIDGRYVLEFYGDLGLGSGFSENPPKELLELLESIPNLKTCYWKSLDQHNKQAPVCIFGDEVEETFVANERGVKYEINFSDGYSQGIFLDQRENRSFVRERSEGKRILNLFSYTCAFSVTCGLNGGITTSLDLSNRYLEWGKRNFELNGIDPSNHYFCKGDAFEWLEKFKKSGRSFDGIIIDPPTFSRGKKKMNFRVEDDYHELIELSLAILEDGGWILATTNCQRMSELEFSNQVETGAQRLTDKVRITDRAMPFDFDQSDYLKTRFLELV